jgi:diguanylate cyclase (GGDEF)-like protein/PAS domain S-box-containing protein
MAPSWLTELLLNLPDSVVLIDAAGRVKWANPTAEKTFGMSCAAATGIDALDLVHPDDREFAALSLATVRSKAVGTPIELRLLAAGDSWRLMELVGSNLLGREPVDGLVLCIRDLTERRRWEVATDATERFRSLVHNSSSILMLARPDGAIESVSAAVTRVLGHDQEELEGQPLEELVMEEDRPTWLTALARSAGDRGHEAEPVVIELDLKRRGTDVGVPFELSIVNLMDDPTVQGLVVSAHNISQLHSARMSLEHLATRDPLTGLPNRGLILDRLERMQSNARRSGSQSSVLFVDLDGFKDVNDTLGHRVGDEVLCQVASRFEKALRESDSIGRIGGDEFVVLVEGSEETIADTVAQRLLDALRKPFEVPSDARPELTITASVGIVSGNYVSAEDLLVDADIALYEAKALGRNRAVRFEKQMRGEFQNRIELEKDLRQAVVDWRFSLVYQPILGLENGDVQGVEALLRWHHPSGRILAPGSFLPVLEETGLIVDVSERVLLESCRRARHWHDLGLDVSVAVNVSPRQFHAAQLHESVARALESSGLPPRHLVLEMTETALMTDALGTARRLRELQTLGVRLAVDDFGAGYSSLAYLQRYPVDIVKIDRSFVSGITPPERGAPFVHTLVELGNSLGLETVAEGIETSEQLRRVRDEGCDAGQGYYFSPPLDVAAIERFLLNAAHRDSGARGMIPSRRATR